MTDHELNAHNEQAAAEDDEPMDWGDAGFPEIDLENGRRMLAHQERSSPKFWCFMCTLRAKARVARAGFRAARRKSATK